MLRHACGFALADQGADTWLIQHTVIYTASNPEYSGESVPGIPGESVPPIPWQSVPLISGQICC